MNQETRLELIKKYLDEGLTYREIGEKLGISKQRVYQLAMNYTTVNQTSLLKRLVKSEGTSCYICESTENIVLHHINENSKDNRINNLVTLCYDHHVDVHRIHNPTTLPSKIS